MNNERIGQLILSLRKEKGITQRELANLLHISDRTVSKWERGQGCPDISILPQLAELFGIQIEQLLDGELQINDFVGGNMKKTTFYVCESCHNVVITTGQPTIVCCDRKLQALTPQKATDEHIVTLEPIEDDWYMTSDHPMTKEHYISFIAIASGDRVQLIKQYPEWTMQRRIPKRQRGILSWYCTQHGLFYQNI